MFGNTKGLSLPLWLRWCSQEEQNLLVFCSNLAGMHLIYPFTGLTRLESLNMKWCNCITDADMKSLSGNFPIVSISAL